jgi:predicted metal-dependent enzyme (double-stranded beta helix superfamily)
MTMQAPLQQLINRLDAAVAAPRQELAQSVTDALGEALAAGPWLSPEMQRASHDHYARHVVYADPGDRYTIVAIAWGSGQQSPIHGHHTWCGVAVYSGTVFETFYESAGNNAPPRPLQTLVREPGTLSFDADLAGVHRIGNTTGDVAVSIHVYGVGGSRIATDVNRVLG